MWIGERKPEAKNERKDSGREGGGKGRRKTNHLDDKEYE